MGEAAALEKDGVERDLQELLADQVHWCGEGFRLVRREWPTDIGPVDLMCRDEDDGWIAVEIKRIGTIDAVEQLTRYLERIRAGPGDGDVPRRPRRAGGQAAGAGARRVARDRLGRGRPRGAARRARAGPRALRRLIRPRGAPVAWGMASPREGDPAPDFELPGTDGPFRLSDHRGRRVLLLFYPGDNTPVCTRQFCSYRDHGRGRRRSSARSIVGISGQDLDSHAAFAAKHGLNVPLLADEDGAVAKAYGAWRPVVGTRRAVFAIDEEGVIRHRHMHALGLDYQDVDELRQALAF